MNGFYEVLSAVMEAQGAGNTSQLRFTQLAEMDAQMTMNTKSHFFGGEVVNADGSVTEVDGTIKKYQDEVDKEAHKDKPDSSLMGDYNNKYNAETTKGNMWVQQSQEGVDGSNSMAQTMASNVAQTTSMGQSSLQAMQALTQMLSSPLGN